MDDWMECSRQERSFLHHPDGRESVVPTLADEEVGVQWD